MKNTLQFATAVEGQNPVPRLTLFVGWMGVA